MVKDDRPTATMEHSEIPTFSGKPEDWNEFQADFLFYLKRRDNAETVARWDRESWKSIPMFLRTTMLKQVVVRPDDPASNATLATKQRIDRMQMDFEIVQGELQMSIRKAIPTEWTKPNAERIRTDPPSVVWTAITQRYKTETETGLTEATYQMFGYQPQPSTVDHYVDRWVEKFDLVNQTYSKLDDMYPGVVKPPLIPPPMQANILYMGLTETRYTQLDLIFPDDLVDAQHARDRMKKRFGTTILNWKTTNLGMEKTLATQANSGQQHPKRKRETRQYDPRSYMDRDAPVDTRPVHNAKRFRRSRPDQRRNVPDNDKTMCRHCHALGHFAKPSQDGKWLGCEKLETLEKLKASGKCTEQ